MDVKGVLDSFLQDAFKIYDKTVEQIILYGSYARGDNKADSDLDILLVVSLDEKQIKKLDNLIFNAAYDIGLVNNIDIQPMVINDKHFAKWKNTHPFYQNVLKDGVILYAKAG